MSYYNEYGEDAKDTFLEQIETLEDALNDVQTQSDEYLRLLTQCFWAFHDCNPIEANKIWWDEPTLQAELPPKCFVDKVGGCVSETALIKEGSKPKSYCKLWERWTNCREVGHCVKAAANE